MEPIGLAQRLSTFTGYFQPHTKAEFNKHDVMVVKTKGEFPWHKHDDTDDFFLVLEGQMVIRMREGNVTLNAGEMFVVPKGVEHSPYSEKGASVLLIEPTGTANTGDPATAEPRRFI